jgi:hypothetical protein
MPTASGVEYTGSMRRYNLSNVFVIVSIVISNVVSKEVAEYA